MTTMTATSTGFSAVCIRADLASALNSVASIVKSRTPKPILQCVRLSKEGDGMLLATTNLEVSIRRTTALVQWEEEGEILVDCAKLAQIVSVMSDENIKLRVDGETLIVTGNSSSHKLPTQPAADFPPIPEPTETKSGQVNGKDLLRIIRQTVFAIGDDVRYCMGGVSFLAKGKKLEACGTNGKVLALATAEWMGEGLEQVTLAPITLSCLAAVVDDENVSIWTDAGRICFQGPDYFVTSNTLEGKFPPYNEVTPKAFNATANTGLADLRSATAEAAIGAGEENPKLSLVFNAKGLNISTQSTHGGANINLPMKYTGPDITFNLSPVWIAKALAVVESDEVKVLLIDNRQPMMVTADSGKNSLMFLLMPVVIKQG